MFDHTYNKVLNLRSRGQVKEETIYMTEDQEKTKRAKERDHFCVNLDKLVEALRFRKPKEIQLAIANAFNAYAGPENQEPDLVLAESLWDLDKTLIKTSIGSVDFFLELDKTKAPPWAFYFLQEILRGPPSIAEQAQVKHIEILSLFVAIIAFVGGGLFSHLTASSDYNLGSLVEFGLMLIGIFSVGLGLVAKNWVQVVLRMGLGLISVALAVCLVFLLS